MPELKRRWHPVPRGVSFPAMPVEKWSDRVMIIRLAAEPQFSARMDEIFRDFDVLLTPTIPTPPWPLLRFEGRGVVGATMGAADITPFTVPWNVSGQPAASIPAGFTDAGLPLAVQLIGRAHDETTLLSLAAQMEAERPWAERRPALAA